MKSALFQSFLFLAIASSTLAAVLEIILDDSELQSDVLNKEWQEWKLEHGKVYKDVNEENQRKMNFLANRKIIAEHNIAFQEGQETFSMGLNSLSDLSEEEFNFFYATGLDLNASLEINEDSDFFLLPANVEIPSEVDWRKLGAVTPVKNQGWLNAKYILLVSIQFSIPGSCGSCWAFSAVGALEGQAYRQTNQLVSLSEQELIDCSHVNHGCHGGWPYLAFDDIARIGGLDTEAGYPYEGRDHQMCRFKRDKVGATDKGHVFVRASEEDLKYAVATVGPISVAVSVTSQFQQYRGGVFRSCSLYDQVNHAVLVVGYGSENGQDYWLVKNSWGTYWGDQGYIKIARNANNMCHIASYGAYPKV